MSICRYSSFPLIAIERCTFDYTFHKNKVTDPLMYCSSLPLWHMGYTIRLSVKTKKPKLKAWRYSEIDGKKLWLGILDHGRGFHFNIYIHIRRYVERNQSFRTVNRMCSNSIPILRYVELYKSVNLTLDRGSNILLQYSYRLPYRYSTSSFKLCCIYSWLASL